MEKELKLNERGYLSLEGVSVYDDKNDYLRKSLKRKRRVTINWSGYGEVNIKKAEKFYKELGRAIEFAKTLK